MRAVVADPNLLALTGTDAARVRIAAWVIGSAFAALTGILIAPTLSLNAGLLSALVVQAFGAVAIGRFSSLPLTYTGGLVIGVSAALATKYLAGKAVLGGIPAVIPFLVLIAVMLVTPARHLPRGVERQDGSRPERRRPSLKLTAPAYTIGAVLLVTVPSVVGARLPVYTTALVFVILFLSLSLLTQVSGQISLAHAAFAGVGAASFSRFTVGGGYPWLVGLLAAGLVTGLVGVVLALPSMRLSGLYLALATFGFGLLMENVVFQTSILFGNEADGLRGLHPQFGPINARSDTAYYYVVLAAVAVSCAALVALRRARLGRFLRALADSPTALTTVGLGVNVTRVIVFATSAFFAGVAGALFIVQAGRVSSVTFGSINSLLYLAALTVAGAFGGFVIPAFVAGALLFIMPSYLTSMTLEVQSMLFGGTALLAALLSGGRVDWVAGWARVGQRLDGAIARSDERRWRTPIAARTGALGTGPEPSPVPR
jgi:ABC-type branched-subunit amino acid transport system permease subunit